MSVNQEFAHRELRDLAFSDPETLLLILGEPEGLEALARVWNGMEASAGGAADLAGRDFGSTLESWPDGTKVGVLRLPRAMAPGDVIMAAVVMGRRTRFFTLEASVTARNALCEWERRPEGFGHADYGAEVDPPEPVIFAEVARRVALGRGA